MVLMVIWSCTNYRIGSPKYSVGRMRCVVICFYDRFKLQRIKRDKQRENALLECSTTAQNVKCALIGADTVNKGIAQKRAGRKTTIPLMLSTKLDVWIIQSQSLQNTLQSNNKCALKIMHKVMHYIHLVWKLFHIKKCILLK